jgi:hypothetical protein
MFPGDFSPRQAASSAELPDGLDSTHTNHRNLCATEPRIRSMSRTFLVALVAAWALLALPSASAKNFGPGDLQVCNATRCVAIVNRSVLPQLSSFYLNGPLPTRVRRPPLGTPYYELRFRDGGYVTGIVATRRLDRFLSYGVAPQLRRGDHVRRFTLNTWYAVPRRMSVELRRLTDTLRPLRLTRAALAKSR